MYINPLDKIQSYYNDLTQTDKEIAIFFINHAHDSITGMSAEEIARKTKTSKAAVSRFCQKIGYSGFSDFRFSLARALVSINDAPGANPESNPIVSISELYAKFIQDIPTYIQESTLSAISQEIIKARKVKIFARNRTYNSALQFKQRLNRMGVDTESVSDQQVADDIIDLLTPEDVAIIFTTTDNTHAFAVDVKRMAERKCKIIVFTMNPSLPFKKLADYYVTLPRISKNGVMSFLDDQPMFMVFIEILLNNLAKHINAQ